MLRGIIQTYRGEMLVSRNDAFYTLVRSIVGQQISVKAADSVWARFAQLTVDSGQATITHKAVAKLTDEALRSCGLSGQKVSYMRALCDYFAHHRTAEKEWAAMNDGEVVRELTSIRGIGRWSAEMFMIFHLGRPDVLPLTDIGLQKAMFLHYFNGKKVPLPTLRNHAERWAPYRSVATWYLWRSLDPVPVSY